MTLKKSHKWAEAVEARCPHCGFFRFYIGVGDEGDIIRCRCCGKDFQLGRQK